MNEDQPDAAASAPTRRSLQSARPSPPPLPFTEPVGLIEPADSADTVPAPVAASMVNEAEPSAVDVLGLDADADATVDVNENAVAGAGAHAGPAVPASPELAWAPPAPRRPPALAGWALTVAITGLIVSLVVGWGFPVGIIAVITAIAALRRPGRRRQAAAWALAFGVLSILYSALWIAVAASHGPLF